jgi:predicted nucleotidyltransferase component of viral defense system
MKYSNIELHKKIILEFLHYLNKETNRFILKGGTALYLCYGLDRFSEDIDLDSEKGNISNLVKNFCKFKRFSQPNEKKNTTHGQRFMIDYGVEDQLLKIETSHRDKIDKKAITKINNILVFKLDELIIKKCNAFFERDKIRDLYDVCYVVNKY